MKVLPRATAQLWLATGALVSTLALSATSRAQVSGTWLGGDGWGEWLDGSRWSSAPAYPDNGGTAYFSAAYAGDVHVFAPITISKITFEPASEYYRVGEGPQPNIQLVGAAEINVEAAPAAVYGSFNVPTDDYTTAPMIGGLTGPNGFTKTGGGVLRLSGWNDFTGDIRVNDGTLVTYGGGPFPVPASPIVLNGGTLRTMGATLANPITVGAAGGRIASGSVVEGPISGAGALEFATPTFFDRVTIAAASSFTGTATVNGVGSLVLSDSGSLGQSPLVVLRDGNLLLDNAASAASDRVGDASRISIRTGALQLTGNAAQSVTENVGTIEFSQTAALSVTPASSGTSSATLRALALKRIDRGLITIAAESDRARIELVHAPTLVGGGGAPGSQNISIVPFARGAAVSRDFVTFDNGRLRRLQPAEYATAPPAPGEPTDRNVSLSASTVVNTPVTVNALRVGDHVTLGGPSAVTIASGAMTMLNDANVIAPINFGSSEGVVTGNGTLSGAIQGSNGVTFGSGFFNIASTSSTYTGPTTIQQYSTLYVLADVPTSGAGPLGSDTSPVQLAAKSELSVGPLGGNSTFTFARPISINGFDDPMSGMGAVRLASGFNGDGNHVTFTGDINAHGVVELTGGDLTFDGTITGDARFRAFPLRTVTFNQSNAFTGGVTIANGTLVIGNDEALGSGRLEAFQTSIIAGGGTPRTLANEFLLYSITIPQGPALTFTGPVHTFFNGQIDSTSDADVTLAGPINGANLLTFNGTAGGGLRLSGSSPNFEGTTVVTSGALYVQNAAALGSTTGGTSVAPAGSINIAAGVTIAAEPLAIDASGIVATSGSPTPQLRGLGNGSSAWNGPITFTGGDAVIGVESNGTMSLPNVTLAAGKSLAKVGPGTLVMPRVSPQEINVADGTLRFTSSVPSNQSAKTFRVTVGIASSALDLADNDLHITGGNTLADVEAKVRAAYDFGNWDGAGISSSTARDNPTGNTTLGVMSGQQFIDNSGADTFDGNTVNATDVLVKYTYFGDVDFNGSIDVSDYNLIDFGFVNHLTGWSNGDADYSGAVDVADYNLIDYAFTTQNGTVLRAIQYLDGSDRSPRGMNADPSLQEVASHFEQFGENYASGFLAAVPEPASTGLLIVAASALTKRRRRGERR